jgi:hypothetical protein
LPQLIDVARSFGAEEILDRDHRAGWFNDHTELEGAVDLAQTTLNEFDDYLHGFGIRLRVEGIGLSRGARVTSGLDLPIPDLMFSPDR